MKKPLILAIVLSALLIAVPVKGDPGILYVDDDPGCGGNTPCYSSIQTAIDNAGSGDVISVAAGTYNENLIIPAEKDNLTLQGEGKTVTEILVTDLYGVAIYADGITFEGFTVRQNSASVVQKALGLMNGATDCTISNSIFDGTGSTKSGSMGILIRDSNNTVDNVESFGWYGYGIDVYSGGAPYADNIVIQNSYFHDNGWFNVAVDRSTNVTVQNCTLSGGGTGIVFFETDGAPVTGGKVIGCTISGATYDGVRLVGSGVLVDSNEIYGCATTTDPSYPPDGYGAVRVTTNRWPYYAANNNTVTNNNIHDNLGNGVLIDQGDNPEPTGNVFHCNNIVNNTFEGFEASTLTSAVDAEYNWWGDASGPSGVGPGAGDSVSANVDFDPWMTTPVDGVCPPPAVIAVEIDIKPGSYPNSINPKSKGKIPVAILSTEDFNATNEVDRNSLTFGRTGDEGSLAFCNPSPEDVNDDGYYDLVCHFYTQKTGFQSGDEEGVLKGQKVDGVPIEGRDTVNIVPKGK